MVIAPAAWTRKSARPVTLTGPLADLRRLLYCGEWISSHALHIYMLHAPDFLGYPGAVELARDHRETVERGLSLRRAGCPNASSFMPSRRPTSVTASA
jgi:coenzyme F420-reducing hydrogenase alpha subunit